MYEEKEQLEVDIQDLKNAYKNLVEALNNIVDVDGLDEQYKELELIADEIDNERINLEIALEKLQEDNDYDDYDNAEMEDIVYERNNEINLEKKWGKWGIE